MQIEFSVRFLKSFKKLVSRRPEVAISVLQKVLLFSSDPFSPSLALHKLKGRLNDVWSFSVENDVRIIVDREDPNKVVFVDIGSHDQVY
jgi:addiction module RelE/StbE family toxin